MPFAGDEKANEKEKNGKQEREKCGGIDACLF